MKIPLNWIKQNTGSVNDPNYPNISYMSINIIGYATIAARLKLSDLQGLLLSYIEFVKAIVDENKGNIERIIGDHVSAYWIHKDNINFKTNHVMALSERLAVLLFPVP